METPVRSQKTVEIYNRCLTQLKAQFNDTTLGFLKNHNAVIDWIESLDRAMNTKKIFYITIVSTLKDLNHADYSAALKVYKAKQDEYNQRAQQVMEAQEMSEREEALWIDWPDVLKLRDRLYPAIDSLQSYQEYVILCLYTYLPPMRADYAPMVLVRNMADVPTGANALVIEPRRMNFVFQEYKTASRYGRKEVPVPRPLQPVLREWAQLHPSECLLTNPDGSPMDAKQLSTAVMRIFERHTGKKTGINILRHSFISYMRRGEKSFKKQKHIANLMGHSVGMSVLYKKSYSE